MRGRNATDGKLRKEVGRLRGRNATDGKQWKDIEICAEADALLRMLCLDEII